MIIIAAALSLMLTGCDIDLAKIPDMIIPAEDISTTSVPDEEEITPELLYDMFAGELRKFNTKVTINRNVDASLVTSVIDSIQRNSPDIFWINAYTITTGTKSTEVEFEAIDSLTPMQLREMSARLEEKAQELIDSIPEGLMDYDKILYIHDTIIRSTSYDKNGSTAGKNGLWGTAYGCLVNGDAVCQGYSEAFVYIMGKLGIEAGMCSGSAGDERHAWNYVKLGNDYYWLDLTWDDPESTDESGESMQADNLRHTYFLIDDEMLMRTRIIDDDQDFVPECNSVANNYFVRSGCFFDDYSIEALGWVMLQNEETRSVEFMFSDRETFDTAVEKLFDEGEIWDAGEYVWLSDQVHYSKDDVMYVITINY